MTKLSGSIANLQCQVRALDMVFYKAEVTFLPLEDQYYSFSLNLKFTSDVTIVDADYSTESSSLEQSSELEKSPQEQLTISCNYKDIFISLEDKCRLIIESEDKQNQVQLNSFDLSFKKEKKSNMEHVVIGQLEVDTIQITGKYGLLVKRIEDIITKIR